MLKGDVDLFNHVIGETDIPQANQHLRTRLCHITDTVQPWSFRSRCDVFLFSTEPISRRVRVFYYQEAECLLCMNAHS